MRHNNKPQYSREINLVLAYEENAKAGSFRQCARAAAMLATCVLLVLAFMVAF